MADENKNVMTSGNAKRWEVDDGMTDSEKLDLLVRKVSNIESDVTELKSDVTELKSDVTELKSDVTELKSDVTELKNDVTELKNDVTDLKTAVTSIELNLENNIQVQIQRVAEGHLDLKRGMDGVMGMNSELEMHSVRIGKLEYDMGKMKKRLA